MKLPKLAIENYQFTIVVIVLLIMYGLVSLLTMPRSEDPAVAPAASSVIVVYPGANPVDMEELVTDPIEEVLNELEDIKRIRGNSSDGLSNIQIEFVSGSDPDDKYSDVVQKVNSIRNDLPEGIVQLELLKWSVSDVHILQLAFASDRMSYADMEKEADRLKTEFEKQYGVKRVKLFAVPEQEVRVSLDLPKLAQYHIPINQVINALKAANQNIPGGNLDIGNKRFNIKTSGSFESLDDIRNVIIHGVNGKILYLKDVAEIDYDHEDLKYKGRFNGERAIFLGVTQKVGTNIFDVSNGLEIRLQKFKENAPPALKIETVFDQSQSVHSRISKFFMNLIQGLILVGFVVLLAASIRASIIVMIVIPISILTGLGLIDLSGYGLQQMTISGFVIALGLLVDNAIVVTENIARYMRLGYNSKDAAVKGTSEVAWAIVSSTVTTVLAFVPMMMIGDVTGDFIRSMPVTVVYTLIASLFISLTLTPYLSSKFLEASDNTENKRVRKLLNRLIEGEYSKRRDFGLKKPMVILFAIILLFAGSLFLFKLVGITFFPKAEKPQFMVNIWAPEGTSLDKTEKYVDMVEAVLASDDRIVSYASNIGNGNPRIYYNVMPAREKTHHAQILANTKEYDIDAFPKYMEELRSKFDHIPGVEIEVKEFEQGPPIEAPVAIRVFGENLDKLKEISTKVESVIKETEGTVNVRNPLSTSKTDLWIKIDHDKAGMLGVPLVQIDQSVRLAINGMAVTTYRDAEGKDYDIVLRLPEAEKMKVEDLSNIYITSITGAQIPLKQLATIEFKKTPMIINHYDLERLVTITSDVTGGKTVNEVTENVVNKLKEMDWQKGYYFTVGGEQESRQESFGGMIKAVLVAILGIFAVLVLQFRSYVQPTIVFSAIPLALIGSVLALLITGNTFSFSAFIGLTSLVGIVVNNSIILVDYTNQLRREGKSAVEAIKEATEVRFIPIVLTTSTTIGGLLPLTLYGGSLWQPMGWTIIGGLIASTFLTLMVVPVLYKIFTKNGEMQKLEA